jgi:hypothetical protein
MIIGLSMDSEDSFSEVFLPPNALFEPFMLE